MGRKGSPKPTGFPKRAQRAHEQHQERQHAFRTRVEPEIEVLLGVAQTLTGSWADAEDLLQGTLIRAYRAIEGFDGADPRAWLLTIIRHTNLNSHRRQRPDLVREIADLDGLRPSFGAVSACAAW